MAAVWCCNAGWYSSAACLAVWTCWGCCGGTAVDGVWIPVALSLAEGVVCGRVSAWVDAPAPELG